tara:strand:+ start:700 stop:1197 length:498 start_codon:yes stop_codon:yes gene_type:complete
MDIERAFRILGVGAEASLADAKRRFRLLVRRYHPDRTGTDLSRRHYEIIVESYRLVEHYLKHGPAPEDDGELDLGSPLNVLELSLGGQVVPISTIGSVTLEGSSHDNDSGIAIVLRFSTPWRGSREPISVILELDGEHGRMGGTVLAVSSDGKGAVSSIEFEPVL